MLDVAVIVGGGGEIGGACAVALAPFHRHVVLVDVDLRNAEATAALVRNAGATASVVVADAAADDFPERVVGAAADHGLVSSVVYAIAHEEHAPAADISLESIDRSYRVGPRAALSLFRSLFDGGLAGGASLTVIGSLHARHSFANAIGYNMAQASLAAVVTSLAHEWAAAGVRVNAVVPGWTLTRGEERLYGRAFLDRTAELLPLGRFGRAEDVANAVAFIASMQAAYVSGTFLTVDGALAASLATLPRNGEPE
jgi:NAD(P)-dependent dehydrogenase (short-subunit alcohol dehydrogenase family)